MLFDSVMEPFSSAHELLIVAVCSLRTQPRCAGIAQPRIMNTSARRINESSMDKVNSPS
jgi:hypothetical protein